MATSPKEISLRMAYRKKSSDELAAILNNNPDELEATLAKEELEKRSSEPSLKRVPKKKVVLTAEERAEKVAEKQEQLHPELTEEENKALSEAEVEFENRQANRKTSSKEDKAMKEQAEEAERAKKEYAENHKKDTKRKTLDESVDVKGMKVGSRVTLKGSTEVGTITRIYVSSDGKEKVMVQFGEDSPIKKRSTSLVLAK